MANPSWEEVEKKKLAELISSFKLERVQSLLEKSALKNLHEGMQISKHREEIQMLARELKGPIKAALKKAKETALTSQQQAQPELKQAYKAEMTQIKELQKFLATKTKQLDDLLEEKAEQPSLKIKEFNQVIETNEKALAKLALTLKPEPSSKENEESSSNKFSLFKCNAKAVATSQSTSQDNKALENDYKNRMKLGAEKQLAAQKKTMANEQELAYVIPFLRQLIEDQQKEFSEELEEAQAKIEKISLQMKKTRLALEAAPGDEEVEKQRKAALESALKLDKKFDELSAKIQALENQMKTLRVKQTKYLAYDETYTQTKLDIAQQEADKLSSNKKLFAEHKEEIYPLKTELANLKIKLACNQALVSLETTFENIKKEVTEDGSTASAFSGQKQMKRLVRKQAFTEQKAELTLYLEKRERKYHTWDKIDGFFATLFRYQSQKLQRRAYINYRLIPALEKFADTGSKEGLQQILASGLKDFSPRTANTTKPDYYRSLRYVLLQLEQGLFPAAEKSQASGLKKR